MKLYPNAKINIGLNIVRRRADGYHDIETIFYPIGWYDELELAPSEKLEFRTQGIAIEGDAKDNLVLRAYHLLKADFPQLPTLRITLYKKIPMGAGLGGGSSDAAFMLMGMNHMFQLHLTPSRLMAYAAQLGADCPFFILNKPAFATGIGENLQPIPLDLSPWTLVVIRPDDFVSTREAFAHIRPQKPDKPLSQLIQLPLSQWNGCIVNDFEPSIFPLHPVINQLKAELYRQGAIYASMSGSGSSVYGLFQHITPTQLQEFKSKYNYVYAGQQ